MRSWFSKGCLSYAARAEYSQTCLGHSTAISRRKVAPSHAMVVSIELLLRCLFVCCRPGLGINTYRQGGGAKRSVRNPTSDLFEGHPSDHPPTPKPPETLVVGRLDTCINKSNPFSAKRAWKANLCIGNKQTNKNLRCGNRKGLLSRNDQTHHRMGPKTMESIPPSKRNTQADIQLRTRQIVAPANKSPAGD